MKLVLICICQEAFSHSLLLRYDDCTLHLTTAWKTFLWKNEEFLHLPAYNVYFWLLLFLASILQEWLFMLVVGDLPAAAPPGQLQWNSTLNISLQNPHLTYIRSIYKTSQILPPCCVCTPATRRDVLPMFTSALSHFNSDQFSEVLMLSALSHQTSANHHWKPFQSSLLGLIVDSQHKQKMKTPFWRSLQKTMCSLGRGVDSN